MCVANIKRFKLWTGITIWYSKL
uniref:Uncharacterized protein n=1 Tax=Rhizophora mucronata TaxID=61149 RepID=A0A2P2K9L8_RHIMU